MGASLVPNPISLGFRALTFGLNNIENARLNQPGFPKGAEPKPDQANLLQEGGATAPPGLGSRMPSIYSQIGGGKVRTPDPGPGGRGGSPGGRK